MSMLDLLPKVGTQDNYMYSHSNLLDSSIRYYSSSSSSSSSSWYRRNNVALALDACHPDLLLRLTSQRLERDAVNL